MPSQYWDKWQSFSHAEALKLKSWVNPVKLRKVMDRVGMVITKQRQRVLEYLKDGAEIGCQGEARLGTKHKNCRSVIEEGKKLADMIQVRVVISVLRIGKPHHHLLLQSWIVQKICIGPMDSENLPWSEVSISPLKAVRKPNGKIRPVRMGSIHLSCITKMGNFRLLI